MGQRSDPFQLKQRHASASFQAMLAAVSLDDSKIISKNERKYSHMKVLLYQNYYSCLNAPKIALNKCSVAST